MKKLIILFFLTLAFSSYSQIEYFKDFTRWRMSSFNGSNPNCLWTYEINNHVKGDSIYNGKTYKKLFTYVKYWNFFHDPTCGNEGESFGLSLIRQDSLKVYQLTAGNEQLIYDFDLELNDTIFEPNNPQTGIFYSVKKIDTVYIDSQPRKRFWTGDSVPFFSFLIEGVGHNKGFFENYTTYISSGSQLNCFSYNGHVYPILDSSACNFNLSTLENLPSVNVDPLVFPNPTNGKVEIKHNNSNLELRLYDLRGVILYCNRHYENGKIDFGQLHNGTYLLAIKIENEIVWKKLIKE